MTAARTASIRVEVTDDRGRRASMVLTGEERWMFFAPEASTAPVRISELNFVAVASSDGRPFAWRRLL